MTGHHDTWNSPVEISGTASKGKGLQQQPRAEKRWTFRTGKGIHVVFAPEAGSRVIRLSFEVFTHVKVLKCGREKKECCWLAKFPFMAIIQTEGLNFPTRLTPWKAHTLSRWLTPSHAC